MPLRIVRNDITKMNTDAIVNTASSKATFGAGTDTAVYMAAGMEELLALRKEIGEVPEGEVFITPGFDLPAKYIIHAVSPLYIDGESGEEEKLRNCYRNSLKLALANGIQSIAFPLISTGSFGYPKADGFRIAMDECNSFLLDNSLDITIVVYDSKATDLAENLYSKLESFIDNNYVSEQRFYSTDMMAPMSMPEPMSERMSSPVPMPMSERISAPMSERMSASAPMLMPTPDTSESKPSRFGQLFGRSKSVDSVEARCSSKYSEDEEFELFTGETELEKRMIHLEDSFGKYMMYLVEQKGKTSVEVQDGAWITKKVYSKIKTHQDTYHPDKRTACQICVGLGLNNDEAKDMLRRAGYSLSPSVKEDIIWSFFFSMDADEYDIFDVSDALEKYDLKPIVVFEEKAAN